MVGTANLSRGGSVAMERELYQFDHLEFYVGNAKQAALFYAKVFGFTITAYRSLETGSRETVSYVLEQGNIRFVLSSGLTAAHPISDSVFKHGDNIAIIALEVPDAISAYKEATSRGAVGAIPPTKVENGSGLLRYSAIHTYSDLLIKFVDRSDYSGVFAPGFKACHHPRTQNRAAGLQSIDHVAMNVEWGEMNRWVKFFEEIMDFSLLARFDDQAISTESSALASMVMQNSTGTIKFVINQPAQGKRKSQIEEYLDYHQGTGIQHVALSTTAMVQTVTQLRAAGVEFLPIPPTYYETVAEQVGAIAEPIHELAELGILVDRDVEGYLLQIFTQTVVDRPTLFFEVIERHGSPGFGEGNIKALFAAMEREQALRGNL
jgi:4-hydroxyphenylpyruvate dioxygenase